MAGLKPHWLGWQGDGSPGDGSRAGGLQEGGPATRQLPVPWALAPTLGGCPGTQAVTHPRGPTDGEGAHPEAPEDRGPEQGSVPTASSVCVREHECECVRECECVARV